MLLRLLVTPPARRDAAARPARPALLSLLGVAVACLASGGLASGCSPLTGAPAGTQCFSAIDCAPGLICVPKGGTSTCSSNLTSVTTEIDAAVDASVGDGGPLPPDGALVQKASDAAATPDAGTKPVDAGHPVDAGSPSKDTGAPAQDAGGSTPVDSGTGT